MKHKRVLCDGVLLPDGKVLALHGSGNGMSGGFGRHIPGAAPSALRQPVYAAEIFDPNGGLVYTWVCSPIPYPVAFSKSSKSASEFAQATCGSYSNCKSMWMRASRARYPSLSMPLRVGILPVVSSA